VHHLSVGLQCSSSLTIAIIVLGVATVVLLVIISFYVFITFRYWRRGRIRASGNLCLKIIAISSLFGLMSVYTFFGKGLKLGSRLAKQTTVNNCFTKQHIRMYVNFVSGCGSQLRE